ncbi:GNAT family N-acetyltransferase [Ponticoccus litoralis]|uniref:GNAT family N-acetyltransferase n=1 Tax=Ponticoccus litoralis TaxID=422297 RepID=A0AAW9SNA2_9RHOB
MRIDLTDLRPGDVDWLVERHGTLYARDEGFDARFPALVRQVLEAFVAGHDPAWERAFIARSGERRLGSIFCVQGPEPGVAKLRLFLLEPEMRGQGLGRRLLAANMAFARDAGYRRMVLWTHESHRAAVALYRRTGWRMLHAEPRVSFGVPVVEQHWETDL